MNTLKIKINYALIMISVVGVTFLTLYYHMGNLYDAFRYTLLFFTIFFLVPTIVILTHSDEQDEKVNQKDKNEQKVYQGISLQPHYAYGSHYENITKF